jgi:hypothetical protein
MKEFREPQCSYGSAPAAGLLLGFMSDVKQQ